VAAVRPAISRFAGDRADLRFVLGTFALLAVALFAVAQVSAALLPSAPVPRHGFPDYPGFDGWTRWDTDWYQRIARDGYYYAGPGRQSAVNFFPGYPAAMKVVMVVVRDALVAGVIVTYAAGLASALLFHRWCRRFLGAAAAQVGVLLLLLYPFSLFLYGAVYADALFLASTLGAFVLLEEDRPWLAGLAGAVATATRPVGVAVVAGLVVRAAERRGWRIAWRDSGVLLSVLGLAGYCALLWHRFGDPLAYTRVYSADGWTHQLDLDNALKLHYFRLLADYGLNTVTWALSVQGLFTLAALALVPVVVRRFGWGYGMYSLLVVAIPTLSSREFLAMGRYLLPAFPCFAAAAGLLAGRRGLAAGWLVARGAGLAVMTSYFARWYLLT
jgi:hypothetical protein